MEQEKHYRHELKFEIPCADYYAMRERLKRVMHADPHTDQTGRYRIRSIYFDNSATTAVLPAAAETALRYMTDFYFNPAAAYSASSAASFSL